MNDYTYYRHGKYFIQLIRFASVAGNSDKSRVRKVREPNLRFSLDGENFVAEYRRRFAEVIRLVIFARITFPFQTNLRSFFFQPFRDSWHSRRFGFDSQPNAFPSFPPPSFINYALEYLAISTLFQR